MNGPWKDGFAMLDEILNPAAERNRWRANCAMLRGTVFVIDDPADGHECPLLTLNGWSADRFGSHLPWKQMRGHA